MAAATLEAILRRDRLIVFASIVALCLLAWLYLFHLAADMASMSPPVPTVDVESMQGMEMDMDMPGMDMSGMDAAASDPTEDGDQPATLATFVFLAAMWMVMMVGMMLPSAAATILLFAAIERRRRETGPFGRTALFVSGYFLIWFAFSILAAAAQTTLQAARVMSIMEMSVTSALAGGLLFILAGLYEFSPLKSRCLNHCRSPLEWIAHHQRPGSLGALRMGAGHGLYCVGCCWMLMLLLFVGGVMNLLWVAALAAIVLIEKLLPRGPLFARLTGATLTIIGVVLIARPLVMS